MKIQSKKVLQEILFLDIETVSCVENYQDLDQNLQRLWDKKAATLPPTHPPKEVSTLFFDKAAIYAEFGKVIVISVGYFTYNEQNELILHVKGYSNHTERDVLQAFIECLALRSQIIPVRLCAHNGKEFDFPYLCRRLMVHGIPLPHALDLAGKKPWEVPHLDTLEMWKFGDRKSFTSLALLAALFNIPSSKTTLDGSQVNTYYYHHNDLDQITEYCKQDVVVTAQIFLKMHFLPLLQPHHIMLT